MSAEQGPPLKTLHVTIMLSFISFPDRLAHYVVQAGLKLSPAFAARVLGLQVVTDTSTYIFLNLFVVITK